MEVIPCIRIMPLELFLAMLSSSSADSSCSHARYAMIFVEDHNTRNKVWAAPLERKPRYGIGYFATLLGFLKPEVILK